MSNYKTIYISTPNKLFLNHPREILDRGESNGHPQQDWIDLQSARHLEIKYTYK